MNVLNTKDKSLTGVYKFPFNGHKVTIFSNIPTKFQRSRSVVISRSLHLYHSFNAHQVLSIRIAHLFNNGPKPLLELEQLFSSSTYREQRERCRVNANNRVTHDDTTTSHQHGMTSEITSCQTIWYLTANHRTWHKNRRNVIWLIASCALKWHLTSNDETAGNLTITFRYLPSHGIKCGSWNHMVSYRKSCHTT